MMRHMKFVACLVCGIAIAMSGCGGGDDNDNNNNQAAADDNETEAINDVLSTLGPSLFNFAGDANSKIAATVTVSDPPQSLPATITITFVQEPIPCASGSGYIDGTMTITINADYTGSATFNITETLSNCTAGEESTVSGAMTITGDMTFSQNGGTMNMNASSSDLTIDGESHSFSLAMNATISAQGVLTACTITGTVDGQAVSEDCTEAE